MSDNARKTEIRTVPEHKFRPLADLIQFRCPALERPCLRKSQLCPYVSSRYPMTWNR